MLNTILGSLSSGVAASTSSYESIATSTSTSGTATFTSIPSTFQHLQIRALVRADNNYGIYMNFNSDTSNLYAGHDLYGNGSSALTNGYANGTAWYDSYCQTTSASLSNNFGVMIWDILDYGSTTKYKTLRFFGGKDNNDSTGRIALESGLWRSTSAISRIDITNLAAWASGTQFALYGIKGS